jgi:exosome complex component RRP4
MAAAYDSDSDSSSGGADIEGDISMQASKRARSGGQGNEIVTPGEVITDDPQWMRHVISISR